MEPGTPHFQAKGKKKLYNSIQYTQKKRGQSPFNELPIVKLVYTAWQSVNYDKVATKKMQFERPIHIISVLGLTDGWDCRHNLPKLELVQNGGLTSSIETNHKDTHLFLGKKPAEQLGKCQPHFLSSGGSLHTNAGQKY